MVWNTRNLRIAYLRARLGVSDWLVGRIEKTIKALSSVADHLDYAAEPRETELFRLQHQDTEWMNPTASSSATKTAPPAGRETT